jgi:hypothetical protein
MKTFQLIICLLLLSLFAAAQPGKEKGKGKKDDVRTELKTTPSGKEIKVPPAAAQEKNARGMEMKEKNEEQRQDRKKERDADNDGDKDRDRDRDSRDIKTAKDGKDKKGDENNINKREKVLTPDQK